MNVTTIKKIMSTIKEMGLNMHKIYKANESDLYWKLSPERPIPLHFKNLLKGEIKKKNICNICEAINQAKNPRYCELRIF